MRPHTALPRVMLACVTAFIAGGGVAAPGQETVWRCDGPEGSRYSTQACDGGRLVAVADPRSAAQVQEARAVAERERRLLALLLAERRQREREAVGGAAGIGPSRVGAVGKMGTAGDASADASRDRSGDARQPHLRDMQGDAARTRGKKDSPGGVTPRRPST